MIVEVHDCMSETRTNIIKRAKKIVGSAMVPSAVDTLVTRIRLGFNFCSGIKNILDCALNMFRKYNSEQQSLLSCLLELKQIYSFDSLTN